MIRGSATDLDDRLSDGASPLAAYAAVLAAAVFIFERSDIGPPLLAGALILLLLINIRNAWDLTLFFSTAQRRPSSGLAPKLVDGRYLHLGACAHFGERLHVAKRLRPDVAGAG